MKKGGLLLLILFTTAFLVVIPAYAKSGTGNIKGLVYAIPGDGTLIIQSNHGELVTVAVVNDFNQDEYKIGDSVLVKGIISRDGTILATSVKIVGRNGDDSLVSNGTDSGKAGSAYCSDNKPDKVHPLALKLQDMFGADPAWVMGYFCDGQGMGSIMLALKMGYITGEDPNALLVARVNGKGWGQIWIEKGWIGKEKEAKSPPGWLNKP